MFQVLLSFLLVLYFCLFCCVLVGMYFWYFLFFFFFSSRRRHTRLVSDWSSDVCSSDLDDVLQIVRMPVAGGISRSQRATEPRHLKTRRPGADRDPVGIEAGDEVKATAVLGLVRVAHPARDPQPLDRGESQVRVGGLRFAVRRALVELEVGEVGVVVEGNPQEHVLVLMEVVESGRPREALGAVGRGEAQFVAVHLRSGIPDEGAVVPPVPLGHVGLRQRRSRRRETAPPYDDVVFPREGVVPRGRVTRP